MDHLTILRRAGRDFGAQLLVLFAGVAVASVLLHLLERKISRRLAQRFGWRSVLVTGWLGVPLHELSHLIMCRIFGHRVVGYALFDPDPRTGTLGYVHHAYRRRSLWQLAGNFFIGIAPLLGGAAAILALAHLLVPAALEPLARGSLPPTVTAQLAHYADAVQGALVGLVGYAGSWRLWVFLLAALCIGMHMSPSLPDIKGALPGLGVLLIGLYAANVVHVWVGLWGRTDWAHAATKATAPLVAVLGVVSCLQLLMWAVVETVIALTTPQRGGMSLGGEPEERPTRP